MSPHVAGHITTIGSTVYGCTDPYASNYNPNATQNDGSCTYSWGCTDPYATNYDPNATTDDGSCVYGTAPECEPCDQGQDGGCCDPIAANYDVSAPCDDGSCLYPVSPVCDPCEQGQEGGCCDPTATNYDVSAHCDDGSCVYPVSSAFCEGRIDSGAYLNIGETPVNPIPNEVFIFFTDLQTDPTTIYPFDDYMYTQLYENHQGNCPEDCGDNKWGCIEENCIQHPSGAFTSLAECVDTTNCPPIPECLECQTQGSIDDVPGCCDSSAYNYNPNATCDDYTCFYDQPEDGPEDEEVCRVKSYLISINVEITHNWHSTYGIPLVAQVFYSFIELATWVDEIQSPPYNVPYEELQEYFQNNMTTVTELCDCSVPVLGCTDPTATNYNSAATVNDGSCSYPSFVPGCDYSVPPIPIGETVSYNELAKGWVSFKSFLPELAISSVNQYYTMKEGMLWKHHQETLPETRNTFYEDIGDEIGSGFTESSITPILNKQPDVVKHFNTLNYEGSQTKVDIHLTDGDYYNLYEKDGWYVEEIFTDKQTGTLNEFIEKEGKWFNYIKGSCCDLDIAAFNFQGLGVINQIVLCAICTGAIDETSGCCDPFASNYDYRVNCDDGSCVYPPSWDCLGNGICGDPGNGQGQYLTSAMCDCACRCLEEDPPCVCGCMDETAQNYNPLATMDDDSCMYCVDWQEHAGSFITYGRFGSNDGNQGQGSGGGAQDFVVHLHANAALIASGPWRFDFSHGAGNHPSDPRPTDTVHCGQPSNEFPLHTFYLNPGETHVYHGPMYFDKHAFMATVNEGKPNRCSGGCSVGGGGGLSPCIGHTGWSTFNPNHGTWGKGDGAYDPCGWEGGYSPYGAIGSGVGLCGCIDYSGNFPIYQ